MRNLIFSLSLLLLACTAGAGEPVLVPWTVHHLPVATEMLVKYRAGAGPAVPGPGSIPALGIVRTTVAGGVSLQAMAAARQDPAVEWVQPNYWRQALAAEVVPNDPYYRPPTNQRRFQQWHLPKINANYAWSITAGQDNFLTAVVDTGVDLNHPDLKDRLAAGTSIVNQDNYTPPSLGMDDNGHGTHVAGLIGATSNNGLGVAGVSWRGKILPVKVLNSQGEGTDADIAAGIVWAADAGARVINLSLGGPDDGSGPPPALQAAVDYAHGKGCMIIAASGNSGDRSIFYPAALPHVVAIAATDPWDQVARYSTFGPFVALAAPGGSGPEALSLQTGILSTLWDTNSQGTDGMGGSEAGEYGIEVGTSMAAAVASGAAAVLWAYRPGLTADQVEDQLKATAADVGPAGPDEQSGAGRIDLLAALGVAPDTVRRPDLTIYNFPNPFNPERESTQIVFILDRARSVKVSVFDVSRTLVWEKQFAAGETLVGKNFVTWTGRNGKGDKVANGAYYLRLTTDDGQASKMKVIAVLR
jgi:subtilisin family serine protease